MSIAYTSERCFINHDQFTQLGIGCFNFSVKLKLQWLTLDQSWFLHTYSHGQELFYKFISKITNKLVKQLLSMTVVHLTKFFQWQWFFHFFTEYTVFFLLWNREKVKLPYYHIRAHELFWCVYALEENACYQKLAILWLR